MKLKVASYNMRKSIGTDRRRRPERTLQVLGEIDADVIALQEADRRFGRRERVLSDRLLTEHTDWRHVPLAMRAASMGWHGNALLVRREIEIVDHALIHLPALEPRGAVTARLKHGGAEFRVIGMHLDLSGLWRRRQAAAICRFIETAEPRLPVIAMGDLNEWSGYSGCLRDFARELTIAETAASYHATRPIGRLDRIMASRDLRITAAGTHVSAASRSASDHLPVWAEVTVR